MGEQKNQANPSQQEVEELKEELRNDIKKTIREVGSDLSKDEKKHHAKLLQKIFENGDSVKEAMGISDETIGEIYSFAYSKFQEGSYADACELFKMLLTLDTLNPHFALSLGICHHRLKNYPHALQCYMLTVLLNKEDPVPFFYAYDCLLNFNDEGSAALMLANVIKIAGNQPKYQSLKTKAQALYQVLETKLKKSDFNIPPLSIEKEA